MRDATQIEYGVTHAAKSRIDADACDLGNFLEAQSLVVAHFENLALQLGEFADQVLDICTDLVRNQNVFNCLLAQLLAVEDIHIRKVGTLQVFRFLLTVVVDDQVVGYARNPCGKLAVLSVAP